MKIEGIGIDIIENKRISLKIASKLLTTKENIEYSKKTTNQEKIDYLCGRWVAKESIIKANSKQWIFSQISIINDKNGKPIVYINNQLQKNILITISHEKKFTVANCVIVSKRL